MKAQIQNPKSKNQKKSKISITKARGLLPSAFCLLLSANRQLQTANFRQGLNSGFMYTAIILFAAGIIGTSAHAQSAQEIVKHGQERYQTIQTFSAEFEETFTWVLTKESRTSAGRFFIKKPDKFRLESQKQTIASDGKTVWRYAPQDSQVFVTDAEEDPDFPLLKDLLFDYVENYTHVLLGEEKLGEVPCFRLRLVPKAEDSYISEMQIWIDKKQWLTKKIIYTDMQKNLTTYTLSDIKVNKRIDDKTFLFIIPEGAEVIETR